jgi:hypothetical protein
MSDHLTDLDLELLRTGEAGSAVEQHLAGCAQCRGQLARIEQIATACATQVPAIDVPLARDRAIIGLAQRRARQVREQVEAAHRRPRWLRPLYIAAPLAAAASITFFVTLQHSARAPMSNAPITVAATAGDINRDGRIDIVDALLLARELKRQQPARDPLWDQNGDGQVDQADVEQIAQTAVSLTRRQP